MFTPPQWSCFIYFLLVVMTFSIGSCEDVRIIIPLNKTINANNREMYGDFVTIGGNSTLQINLTAIPVKKISYIVFQVHSHLYNITLYNNTLTKKTSITGTNVGLYGLLKPTPDTYYVVNKNEFELKLYISIHGYTILDPIPGGCNMELPTSVAPYLKVTYTSDVVSISAAAAQDPKSDKCPGNEALMFYRMYMVERNFDQDSYFESVKKMLTLDQIQENGELVPQTEARFSRVHRWMSAYPGTGAVYVVVALNYSGYAAYVPAVTYACSPDDGCELLDDVTSQLFCAILLFIGIFVCFLGHRFFMTEMFLVGSFAGIIITYILLSIWTDLERPSLLSASVLSGVFFGAIWLLLWWFYGIPVLSVCLSTIHLGFVMAALVYYSSPGFHVFLQYDGNFWTVFLLLMILTSITLSSITYLSNILSCAVLGAYATIFAIDHYIGSNLKYIIINTVRRAVVKDFNKVVLAPPFQWRDAIATVLWVTMATGGFLFQHYHNRGRPPFPPPPRSVASRVGLTSEPSDRLHYGAIENGGRRQSSASRVRLHSNRSSTTIRDETRRDSHDERVRLRRSSNVPCPS